MGKRMNSDRTKAARRVSIALVLALALVIGMAEAQSRQNQLQHPSQTARKASNINGWKAESTKPRTEARFLKGSNTRPNQPADRTQSAMRADQAKLRPPQGFNRATAIDGTRSAKVHQSSADQLNKVSSTARARVFAFDKAGKPVALLPGMLDATLLKRGSFSFGSKLVAFNKLKVLGNVYVNRVNGRPLRETYLFKSGVQGGRVASGNKIHTF